MRQCQKLNGDLASLLVGKMLDEGFEGLAIFWTREECVFQNSRTAISLNRGHLFR